MKLLITVLLSVVVLSGCTSPQRTVRVGDAVIKVDVADSEAEQARGLSGRESLNFDEGMLFVYPEASTPIFWMKDMLIPIDILWLSKGKVVGRELRVPPDDGAQTYTPPELVDAVLELAAGAAEQYGLDVGSEVEYGS